MPSRADGAFTRTMSFSRTILTDWVMSGSLCRRQAEKFSIEFDEERLRPLVGRVVHVSQLQPAVDIPLERGHDLGRHRDKRSRCDIVNREWRRQALVDIALAERALIFQVNEN